MTLTMEAIAIDPFASMLGTLLHLFDKAGEHARAKALDLGTLVAARLAPDMYPFSTQVQLACYQAEDAIARLTGKASPPLPSGAESLDELRARVEHTVALLRAVPADALAGAEARRIVIQVNDATRFEMTGLELLRDWSIPHFYFHVVTAYDILRHLGVEIGKRDYVRHVGRYLRGKPPA